MHKAVDRTRICVIYATEDIEIAGKLVKLLRENWDVWFAEEHWQGDWRSKVRTELETADAVIPLLSKRSQDKPIMLDEWEFATKRGKPIFPFIIDDCEIPFGMGGVNRTSAHGWTGQGEHPGYLSLRTKLQGHFNQERLIARRPTVISVNGKQLALPAFIFSISSFETQLDPIDGVELVSQLSAPACLISAYDAAKYIGKRRTAKFWNAVDVIRRSSCVLFLDSGNYEASRKGDYQSKENSNGWSQDAFYQAAIDVDADVIFSYDRLKPTGGLEAVADDVVRAYERDMRSLGYGNDRLCPIVHLPSATKTIVADAAYLIKRVASEIKPLLVAIPERELGDGLLARMKAVRRIRESLNEEGIYQPLHLLGTGNPTTIAALAACGADTFDGLEWCRTAANYDNNNLLHFQHFDLLKGSFAGRIKNSDVRKIVEISAIPFVLRVASYNYDYFCEWIRTIQRLTRAGEGEFLLSSIPHVGAGIVAALQEP